MRAREVKLQTRRLVATLCAQLAPKRVGLDQVHEGAPPVDLDDRKELAIVPLELGVARDVDLLELEGDVGGDPVEDAARALAEMTTLGRVENDAVDYGYRPRVIVASATRPTASA